VIRERISPGEKSLHLPENSSLKGFLLELGKEQVLKGNILDYPAVASIGYALSHIKSSPTVKVKLFRPDRVSSWKTI
jgi:hypothetical protein